MSNFNNVFGQSNSCPAIMQDGRGPNTNFTVKNDNFEEIKTIVGATTSLEFKTKLTLKDVREQFNEFLCDNDPHGAVTISQNIGDLLSTNGGTWIDNFKNLKN